MAEAVEDGLFKLTQVMASLRTMTETKGVSTSVIKDDNKVKTTLDSAEQSRLKEIAKVIGSVLKVGAYEDKPEATRLGDFTSQSQLALQLQNMKGASSVVQSKIPRAEAEEGAGNLLTQLLSALGLETDLNELKNTATKWITEKLTSFGVRFKDIFKSIIKRLGKFIKSIWEGIKWVGKQIKQLAESFGEKIKNSKFAQSFLDALESAKNGLAGIWESVTKGISSFFEGIAENLSKFKTAIFKAAEQIPGVKFTQRALNWGSESLQSAGQVVSNTAEAVASTATGAVNTISEESTQLAKNSIRKAMSGLIKSSGGAFKLIGKIATKVPILGPLIEGAFTTYDIVNLIKENLPIDELQKRAGTRVMSGIGGLVGGAGGAALFGALGSIIPGAGTALGLLTGAVAGDQLGRFAGELISEYLLPPKYLKTLGAYVTHTTPPADEMQDFIIKNGQVFKFSSKDDVLGMKKGGAVDSLFSNLTQEFARDNAIIRDASIAQVNKLDDLIAILSEYLKRSNNRATPVDTSVESIPNKPFDIRKRFSKQTLIPTQQQLY